MIRSLFLLFLFSIPSLVAAQEITYSTRVVASGLNCPWEIRWGPDNWIWFTERAGRIQRLDPETGRLKLLLRANEVVQWHEAGMLGFDFHPSFPDSPYVYVAYSYDENWTPELSLFRYTYRNDTLTDKTFVFGDIRSNFVHVGCRVVIRGDKIFMSMGEIDRPDSAQSLTTRHGKIFRVNLDGSIPSDNPFPNNPVWSYGHRNPQGLVFGREGILYGAEHGTSIDDEINLIRPGLNYGWPLIEGYCDQPQEEERCEAKPLTEPLYAWTPTLGISGIGFYDHDRIPEWRNSLLVAALRDQTLSQLKLDPLGQRVIEARRYPLMITGTDARVGRLRDVCMSPEGRVFISTSQMFSPTDTSDRIVELSRVGVVPYAMSLVRPEPDAVVGVDSIQLSWQRVAGDALYQIQVNRSPSFEVNSMVLESTSADTSYVLLLSDSTSPYYWRVRETTSQGEWSPSRRFKLGTASVSSVSVGRPHLTYDNGTLRITIPGVEIASASVQILNVLGQPIYETATAVFDNGYAVLHSLHLPVGTYYLRVFSRGTVVSAGFTVLH